MSAQLNVSIRLANRRRINLTSRRELWDRLVISLDPHAMLLAIFKFDWISFALTRTYCWQILVIQIAQQCICVSNIAPSILSVIPTLYCRSVNVYRNAVVSSFGIFILSRKTKAHCVVYIDDLCSFCCLWKYVHTNTAIQKCSVCFSQMKNKK